MKRNDTTASTCLGCTERHLGCHSVCEKYKSFKQKLDKRAKAKIDYFSKHPRTSIKR